MGFGVITGGGADGLYTISLDYGASVRDAMIAERDARIAELEAEIVTVSAEAADARAATAAAGAAMNDAINAYTDALNGIPDGTPEELAANIAKTSKAVQEAFEALNRLQNEEIVPRLKIQMLRERVSELRAEVIRLTNATLSETRQAWCVDLTEDGAGEVATIEIPGETSAVLIASGCQPWSPSDGVMMAREIMSPEQVFWNAAVLPGWQKFKPTYRKGTITALDTSADTASVDLDNATSSAQRLNVNQATALVNVPVSYMACNASAFDVGDRCVVEFQGQAWSSPRVIGFVDNPKGCDFTCIGSMTFEYFKPELYAALYDADLTVVGLFNSTDVVEFHKADIGPPIGVIENSYTGLVQGQELLGGFGNANVFIGNSSNYGGRFVITVSVQPPLPPGWPEDTSGAIDIIARNILEISIYAGGNLIVNLAVTDSGWFGSANYQTGMAKCPGGIGPLYPGHWPVTALDYALTSP